MIQVTDSMSKSNPHSPDRLFIIAVSRLNKPGVKELACPSKREALWKEPTELHRRRDQCVADFASVNRAARDSRHCFGAVQHLPSSKDRKSTRLNSSH